LPQTPFFAKESAMESKIRDMAVENRPREKMQMLGAAALSNEELLAVFLRTGVKGRNAIQIGGDMLQKFGGSLSRMGSAGLAELKKSHSLGLGKASQLVAAFELGRRVAMERASSIALDRPDLVYEHFAPMLAHLPKEKLLVVLLNTRLRLESVVEISSGTVNQTLAHVREILHPVVSHNAHSFLLIHNHPSGDTTPSRADEALTRRVVSACELLQINIADHVIIGRHNSTTSPYFSFREAGLIP
jgi:DNA repair protein RadC